MIDWLAVPIPLEHDVAVSVEAPTYLQAGEIVLVNATVRNRGLNNETNVELRLLVNDTQVSSTVIPELSTGASYSLGQLLGPLAAGTKSNVTAYSPPLSGENVTSNNFESRIVIVPFYRRTYLPPQWVDGGTRMNWSADDNSWAYVLPFDFPFYGVDYQTIYISSNGLITFTGPDSSYNNGIDQLKSKLALAVAWDDWVTGDPYDIYVWQNMTHVGVRWYVRHLSSSYTANFEAILGMNGVIQLDYAYSDGPISATIGVSDGNGETIAEDATLLNYMNTVVFTPPMHEHELVVTLKTPKHMKPGESAVVNATVRNLGLNDESDVELQLLIDDTVVDSAIIPDLLIGQFCTLGYTWAPSAEGTFNITAYTPPEPSEDLTGNNFATKLIDVQETRGLILFDQTHWTDYWMSYSIWITFLTSRGYIVDTLVSGPITPAALEGYDVFVIPQAHASYTLEELTVVQSFVGNGKGLLVIGDDYPWAYTELTGFAGIAWAPGGTGGITTDITPHAVTQGVSTVYLAGPYAQINVSSPALDLIRDQNGSVMLAVSEVGSGRVAGFVDADSIMDWSVNSADNLQLALNMVEWLAAQAGGIGDVAIIDLAVWPNEVYQGHNIYANVTAANVGNVSETFTVSLYYDNNLIAMQPVSNLQPNATVDVSFSWDTTFVATDQNYTMRAVASIVPDETDTGNNLFIDGFVTIRLLSDVNNDGRVNLLDAIKASLAFGATPSDPRWDRFCDLYQDNVINILDMILIGINFGRGY